MNTIAIVHETDEMAYIIRTPSMDELQNIIELDTRVTFEFFEPLYKQHYAHFPLGKNPTYYLNKELKDDMQDFPDYIKQKENKRILIAYDKQKSCVAGLITFHKEEAFLKIDLLLVDKIYRHKGIGRKFVLEAVKTFDGIKKCIVTPLQFGNEATLNFYESVGFKNCGPDPRDQKNAYGIPYKDMHFLFTMTIG
jgi:GNAT superfamily N-acetyltransferase